MSSIHVARQGFVTKSALPSVSRERGTTTVADNRTVLLLNGNGTNGKQNNTFVTDNFGSAGGQGNYSVFFDGTGDTLTGASNAALSAGTGAFTFEVWFYVESFPRDGILLQTGTQTNGLQIGRRNGAPDDWGVAQAGVAWRLTSTTLPTNNQWNHMVVVRDGSNNMSLFLNGTRLATTSTSYTFTQNGFSIGNNCKGNFSNLRYVVGTAVYDPTASTLTVPTSELTAISGTSLLTCQGTVIRDASSNNFAITVNGDTKVATNTSSAPIAITRNGNATQGSFSPFTLPDGQWSNFFDGSGDYLSVPSISTLATSFTIEFWAYFSNADSTRFDFFGLGGSAVLYRPTGNTLNWYIGSDRISGSFNLATYGNRWNHIAICRDSSNNTRLFVNGTQLGSTYTSDTSTYSSTGPTIGWNSGGGHLNGYISNFRILSGTALYTSTFTPPTTPLTAITNTSLLTCQSNRFRDNSSNNFAITRNGDVRVTPWSPFAPTSAYDPATNGGSGYFDGTGDFLSVPDNASFALGTDNFTIEGWIYPLTYGTLGSGSTRGVICGQWTSAGGYSFQIFVINNGSINVEFNGASIGVYSSAGVVPLNAWSHVAIVRNGSTFTLYVNGVSVATATSSASITDSSANLVFGRNIDANIWEYNGYMANARMVKGTAVYTSAFTPPTAPVTNITNTSLLLNFTNAGIFDTAGDNVIETVGNAQIDTAIKKYGSGSLEFDGSGDYIVCPSNQLLRIGSNSFTVEFWFYLTASPNPRNTIFDTRTNAAGSSTDGFAISYTNGTSGTTANRIEVSTSGSIIYAGTQAVSLNTWHHVAVVRNGTSSAQLYINGVLDGSFTLATNYSSTVATFGATQGGVSGTFITGYLDDVRMTIGQARYTSAFTPPTAELAIFGTVPNIVTNSTYGVYQLA